MRPVWADDHRVPQRHARPPGRGAHVYDGVENDKTASWQNGERCIYLPVQKQPGVNVVETVERIKALLPTIREQLPASVTLDVRSDRALDSRRCTT